MSFDKDLLVEVAARQRTGKTFGGVVYARQFEITIGEMIEGLELVAEVYDPEDMLNRLVYLPL